MNFFRIIFIIFIISFLLSSEIRHANGKTLEKALWVWNTSEILESSTGREEFLSFVLHEEFTCIFLQIPGDFTIKTDKIGRLISDISVINVRVYALDGSKDYALPEYHASVLETVDEIIQYNEQAETCEKFYGIQYDIEPYLLPEFKTEKQGWILENYIELLTKISDKTSGNGLAFSVAIPFWFDSPDPCTKEIRTVTVGGVKKPLVEYIIEVTDNIAIMDYRTVAYGNNGIIALAQNELAYASLKNKKVFIGLETKPLTEENLTFASTGLTTMKSVMEEAKKKLIEYDSFSGFAIHEYRSYKKLVNKENF
ncbi:MAG: hypothetical protein ABRQ39_08880 [Candidatus Eremiobacterota bacterium]